jgi:hypothetical protein
MKTPLFAVAAAALLAVPFSLQAADKAPALPFDAAVKIAQDYIKEQGGQRAIVAMTLEQQTLRGKQFWYIKWASPVMGGENPEIGLQIEMNGEISKVVSSPGEAPKGQRRYGVRDMR